MICIWSLTVMFIQYNEHPAQIQDLNHQLVTFEVILLYFVIKFFIATTHQATLVNVSFKRTTYKKL